MKLVPRRIVRLKLPPRLGTALTVAAPHGRHQGKTINRTTISQILRHGRDDELRLPTGTVEADAVNRVGNHGIPKPSLDQLPVIIQVGIGHRRDARDHLVPLNAVQECRYNRMVHSIVNMLQFQKRRGIAKSGMSSVEDTDLHQLIGFHIRNELNANALQSRPTGREVVLEYPLLVGFAEYGRSVLVSQFFFDELTFGIARHGRDSIDHAVGEADIGINPGGELLVPQLGKADHRALGHVPIMGDVVAAQNGKWGHSRVATYLKSLHYKPKHRLGSIEVRQLLHYGGMRRIERACGIIQEISAFRES
mmetsp:Transcript_28484/g.62645  ORF Transcript_28484/g.62645 Transcript_28484/m.62645 type:complete len:307 (-) Transcript_28484:34-954(-)